MTDTETLPRTGAGAPKRLFIKTYGCQMNVYDSERMADVLRPLGYAQTETVEDAAGGILNTCHIREKAAEKVYSELGKLRILKEQKSGAMTIAVAGCVAQAEGEEIMRRQPAVDLVVGPQAYHQLPELLTRTARARGERIGADFAPVDKFDALPKARGIQGVTAFLTVQEGCDKFCTFCVVPYTRGAEWSRPVAAILDEARALADQGVREITLLGQNVNAYHGAGDGGDWSLARLIWALNDIDGLERIRFTTSHPNDMSDDLIAAHGECAKLMPYLHLPVQSGSDRILKRMNRKHTAEEYLRLIERIRAARPDILISGDFIVGFPEETERDFEDTLDLIRAVNYGQAFSFKYSSRPGTPAAERPLVDEAEASDRLHRLQALINEQARGVMDGMVGREIGVLFEKPGRMEGQMAGKSDYLHAVHVKAEGIAPGDLRRVRITEAGPNSLAGALV